jgi:exopolysaccharide biosynthesis polyprenyl glycosylphosphotransferase
MAHLLPLFPSVAPARARALIIGTADDGRTLRERVVAEDLEFDLVGYVRVDGFDDPGSLGIVSDLTRVIAGQRIDTVIICGEHATGASAAQLVWTAEEAGCQVLLMPSPVLADFDPAIAWSGGMPLVQLTRPTLRGGQLVVKRAGDIVLSLALLIGVAPIGFLVALAVRLSSRGPIFFRQIRVGVGGRHFAMYKFRSMVLDAESRRAELMQQSVYEDGRLFKVVDDPRITTVGKWLRRTSLDELPQLWNVLRGDMSLVGPRPPLPSEVALYEEHHYSRFYMKPGMTGPWQVSGRNRVTDFKQVVGIETAYMRQWRLTRDLSILCRTIPAVFRSVGAS